MGKRILNCVASDFRKFSAEELKLAIQAGEGRTVCCEMAIHHRPIIPELTHAEIASAFGGDLILLIVQLDLRYLLLRIILDLNNQIHLKALRDRKSVV